ncbi:MAG: aminopeptidase [Chloroflexi bacterium]|nr:aminopeptidase [Chloroflexota bacterium]
MNRDVIQRIQFDPMLIEGARNATQVCLRLQPEEQLTLIADREGLEIAAALVQQVEEIGARYRVFVLEELAPRPLEHMPAPILADLEGSQVSIFAAQAQRGELRSRMEMMDVINRQRLRHGHMVNITKEIMLEGMKADFLQVDRLSQRVIEKARQAKTVRATSKGGTSIVAEMSPVLKWVKTSGLISPDKWGNLPGGEVFTSPSTVNGRFVCDGVVGDYLCAKYGDLKQTPLTIEVKDARIVDLQCENKELLNEFAAYTRTDENSNRVGEFAIGTNLAVTRIIGNILQDEKIPGIHIAFGHPYNEHTGQTWHSTTHIDCVGCDFDIWLDDEPIMHDGRFLIEGD